MAKNIIVFAGDAHINGTTSICPPLFNLDDGGTYRASQVQRELWRAWLGTIERVKEYAGGAPVTWVFGGDMIEGDAKGRTYQVITRNRADMLKLAAEVIAPAVDISQRVYFLRGTEAHTGKSASLDEQLADDCEIAARAPNSASWWELRLNVDGYRIYTTHHPPGSVRNPKLAREKVIFSALSWGEDPPDLAVFFHVHHVNDTGLIARPRIVTCPAWTLRNAYNYRSGLIERPQVGLVVATVEGGQLTDIRAITHSIKRDREQKI